MQQLFSEWTTYEKVVVNDYMHHRDYFSVLADYLSEHDSPRVMLDLGCGDAKPVLPLLQRFAILHYIGIDQSEMALDLARNLLAANNAGIELINSSMQEGVRSLTGPVDLIVASYSLHHLSAPEKQTILGECRRLLGERGVLAIVDVFREPQESREDYLVRWEQYARQAFGELAEAELADLLSHVHENDFPESLEGYESLGHAAGFGSVALLRESDERLNKLIVLSP